MNERQQLRRPSSGGGSGGGGGRLGDRIQGRRSGSVGDVGDGTEMIPVARVLGTSIDRYSVDNLAAILDDNAREVSL